MTSSKCWLALGLAASSCLFSLRAWSFPDLIRHGYVNCIQCHVSPSGGGTLTDYGRTFSGEGLSRWTTKDEESIFEGLVKRKEIPSWLSLGGDFRGVQTLQQNSQTTVAAYYVMQNDLEAAVKYKKLTVDGSFGRFQLTTETPQYKSRRYFLMYNFTDEWMVRVGRFLPVYGFNIPDHIISTRTPLGFNAGLERENVEASWITDSYSAVLTFSQGPNELPWGAQETSVEGQFAYAFKDTYKIGINGWEGYQSGNTQRNLAGIFANLGFTENLSLESEFDWQWLTPAATGVTQLGFFAYNRLGEEITKGLNLLATAEFWQSDLSSDASAVERYGAGFEFFPRPHFDFQGFWTKIRLHSATNLGYQDSAWFMWHYYF